MSRDYYVTMISPNGGRSGPTRLLGVYSDKQALANVRRSRKNYPSCEFILERSGDGTYANWKLEPLESS